MKNRRSVGTSTQEENDDQSRRPSMHLGKSTSSRQYEPVQVKTISTLKIYHLAVPKTRPRYESALSFILFLSHPIIYYLINIILLQTTRKFRSRNWKFYLKFPLAANVIYRNFRMHVIQ